MKRWRLAGTWITALELGRGTVPFFCEFFAYGGLALLHASRLWRCYLFIWSRLVSVSHSGAVALSSD